MVAVIAEGSHDPVHVEREIELRSRGRSRGRSSQDRAQREIEHGSRGRSSQDRAQREIEHVEREIEHEQASVCSRCGRQTHTKEPLGPHA
jgi:RNA polymerase-binding transcription factor DksA